MSWGQHKYTRGRRMGEGRRIENVFRKWTTGRFNYLACNIDMLTWNNFLNLYYYIIGINVDAIVNNKTKILIYITVNKLKTHLFVTIKQNYLKTWPFNYRGIIHSCFLKFTILKRQLQWVCCNTVFFLYFMLLFGLQFNNI